MSIRWDSNIRGNVVLITIGVEVRDQVPPDEFLPFVVAPDDDDWDEVIEDYVMKQVDLPSTSFPRVGCIYMGATADLNWFGEMDYELIALVFKLMQWLERDADDVSGVVRFDSE